MASACCRGLATIVMIVVIVSATNAADSCPDVKKADIVVVVDESSSVRQTGWEIQRKFLVKMIQGLPIGPEAVQIGLLKFSSKANKVFDLNKYATAKDITDVVRKLDYKGGVTFTDKALALAGTMFTEELGARPKTQKVVFVLTDGASNNPTETIVEAKKLKEVLKAKVIVVGVGNTKEDELKAMASEDKFVLHTKDMDALLEDDFVEKKVIDSIKCITKCETVQKADILFMIDTSQSIKPEGFKQEKLFINTIIDTLEVSDLKVHVGLVAFSDNARNEIPFTINKPPNEIKEVVNKLPFKWGLTRTDLGLAMARNDFFSKKGGLRDGVPKILVILTDGASTKSDLTLQEAKLVKDAGILVVVIGVSDLVKQEELEALATEKRFVIRAKTFADISDFKFIKDEVIESMMCVVMPS